MKPIRVKPAPAAPKAAWRPSLGAGSGPIYLALADSIAADIAAGRLAPGQSLPTHRALAEALKVDLTTVTRAYGEARRRGLVVATVGRGTSVRGHGGREASTRSAVDLSMNLPPQPDAARLAVHLSAAVNAVLQQPDALALLTYRDANSDGDRAAGTAWLKQRLGAVPPERVLVSAGAQGAFVALLSGLARAGDTVVTETLTYPGFRALAAQLGVRLKGLAMDGEGLLPEAFAAACKSEAPKALYCTPTIHNPTTATMSVKRRQAIAAIARQHGVPIIEDDAYGHLARQAPPPLATYAPELTTYVATLAKTLAPGLRIAYVAAPDAASASRLAAGMRATTLMAQPIAAAVARHWIENGTARDILVAIRTEAIARQEIARQALPAEWIAAHADGHHLWLRLPEGWSTGAFISYFQPRGLVAAAAEAFAVSGSAPAAVRLALGAASDREALARQLDSVARALAQPYAIWSAVT